MHTCAFKHTWTWTYTYTLMYSHKNISPKVHLAKLKGQWANKKKMMWLSRNKKDGQVLVRFQSPHLFVSWKHGGSKTLRKTKLLISCLKAIHSQDKEMLSHQLGFEMPGIDHDLLDIQRYRNRKKSTRQVSPLSMSYKTTSNSCIDKNVDMNRQTKLYLIQSCLPSSETTFL